MADRVPATQRLKLQNVAEREVMRYAGNHALWHKHVHNVELDAVQVLKMKEMDQHPNTIDFSSRRTGKTACKELYDLEYVACNADQELGIVAPREAQSLVNLNYHLEAIRRSEILSAYLGFKGGRQQLSDTKYEFMNRSRAQGYGIMAQVDGGDLTMASLEEVDDMPKDRLFSRFLLMLGSTRRLGASASSKNEPQIRITGVFKGADTLTDLLDRGNYHVLAAYRGDASRLLLQQLIDNGWLNADAVDLENYSYPIPVLNAANAIELGLLNDGFIRDMKTQLSDDEFIRQLLCINTSARNLVWEIYLRKALQVGLEAGLELCAPLPGLTYKKRGLVAMGYDHSGHGESAHASRYAVVFMEQIGIYSVPIFCKTWKPGEDETIVARDLVGFWRYFNPDIAMGDAFGIGLITSVNDDLFRNRLVSVDRRTIGEGESTASTWPYWPFSPIRFEGMMKHQMATAVRSSFHSSQAALPYLDDQHPNDDVTADYRLLLRQVINIVPEQTKQSYSSYKMANSDIGDDLFDAYMAAQWGLLTRGISSAPTAILISKKSREQMLGSAPALAHGG